MYLYHAFGVNIADRFFGFTKPWPLLQFAVVVAVTAGIASMSYWLFERYFLKLKARFSSSKKAPAIVPEVALSSQ
jgi:peptidoglycan/LPS O-acetylase OafA/YrhL